MSLVDVLHQPGLARRDQLLLVLAAQGRPVGTAALRSAAVAAGLRKAKGWNVSDILGRAAPLVFRAADGWQLTDAGRKRISALGGTAAASPTVTAATALRAHVASIADLKTAEFVREAISCLEHRQLRAAVVLSWVGAMSILHARVVAHHLAAFNAEARQRDAGWRAAKTTDDLSRMKERDFLNVLEAISVIGKNVKQELQDALTLRNGCGHPNSLIIGETVVAAHIEILVLNVFQTF